MPKGLNKFAKILVRGSWAVIQPTIGTIEITNENTQKVVDTLENIADKSVDILTDGNADDLAQFKALYDEQKYEVIDLGLDIAESEIQVIANDAAKAVASACINVLREILKNPNGQFDVDNLVDKLLDSATDINSENHEHNSQL
jgi:hypothetical protein